MVLVVRTCPRAEHAGPGRGGRTLTTSQQRVITAGRAAARLIEAADALLSYRPAWTRSPLAAPGAGAAGRDEGGDFGGE
jgi:hypothetical protein